MMKENDFSSPEDFCVLCGTPVPEGTWVCRACEIRICGKEREDNPDVVRALWGNEQKVMTLEEYTQIQRKDREEEQ